MGLTVRQGIYAALAVAGVIATGYFNLQFMAEHGGFDISTFIAGGYANPAAASLSADLTVAFAARSTSTALAIRSAATAAKPLERSASTTSIAIPHSPTRV